MNPNIILYEDIGTAEEFGVIKFDINVFRSPNMEKYVDVKGYCNKHKKELKRYYYPLFNAMFITQKFEISYSSVIIYFDIIPFLEYQYLADMYSFDDFIDFEQYGKELLKSYKWYRFEGNNLYFEI